MKKLVEDRPEIPSCSRSDYRFWSRLIALCAPTIAVVLLCDVLRPEGLAAASAAVVVMAVTLLELAAGVIFGIERRGAIHVFAALTAVCIAVFFGACIMTSVGGHAIAPAALALGVFCLTTGVMRTIHLAVEGDRGDRTTLRGIDCAFRLIAGVLLAVRWRIVDAQLVGLCAAALLVGTGLAIASAAATPRALRS